MKLVVDAPLNSLSFGNVSFNILRELWRKKVNVQLFPTGNQVDISAYDKIDPLFQIWLKHSMDNALNDLEEGTPSLRLWHLNGSHTRIGQKQALYTFHELDNLTETEIRLAKYQDKFFVSSNDSAEKFRNAGVDCEAIPCGFDEDFHKTNKQYLDPSVVHFGLMGKFEKRKHTAKIIRLWLDKYGNNNRYLLSVCVTNPFMKTEEMEATFSQILRGKRYSNINFIPYLKTNSEVNDLLNAIDIDLTGLSGAEGWNLPAFNATCLGKWSIVLNATAHKDWATNCNSILVEPCAKTPAYDGKFFAEGQAFNQGNIYTWDRDIVAECMDIAVSKKGQINTNGEALKDEYSYSRSVDRLLKGVQSIV